MSRTRTQRTDSQKVNPGHVKHALFNDRMVEHGGWLIRINADTDMVEVFPPENSPDQAFEAPLFHLDAAVTAFCKNAAMPIPGVNETQGDQVKLPGGPAEVLGEDSASKEPKGKFKPEINKRPKGTDPKGTSKPNTNLGPDSTSHNPSHFNPAVNKRPRSEEGRGGLPDTNLGSDTSGNSTNWRDRVVRIQEDGKNARRRNARDNMNWDTNEVYLWIMNDDGAYRYAMELAEGPDSPQELAPQVEEAFYEMPGPNVEWREVDWHAIAADLLEDYADLHGHEARRRGLHEVKKPKRGPGQLGSGKAQMGEEDGAPMVDGSDGSGSAPAGGAAARRRAEDSDPYNPKVQEEPGKKKNDGEKPSDPAKVIHTPQGGGKDLKDEEEGQAKMGRLVDSFTEPTSDASDIYRRMSAARPSETLLRDIMDEDKWAANNVFMPKTGMYEVLVGQETVYKGDTFQEAESAYDEFVEMSSEGYGSVAGENVVLLEDGHPVLEYRGDSDDEPFSDEFDEYRGDPDFHGFSPYGRRQAILRVAQWALGDDQMEQAAIEYLVSQGVDEMQASDIVIQYMQGAQLDPQTAQMIEEALQAATGDAVRVAYRIAKAPDGSGWERVVKDLKGEAGVDNPWALANWMKGEGYKTKEQGGGKESRREAGPRLKENWGGDGNYSRDLEAESAEELHGLTLALGGEEVDWSKYRPSMPGAEEADQAEGTVDPAQATPAAAAPQAVSARRGGRPFDLEAGCGGGGRKDKEGDADPEGDVEAVDEGAKKYWEDYMGGYGKELSKGDTSESKPSGPKKDEKPSGPKKDEKAARRAAWLRARREAQAAAPAAQPAAPAPAAPAPAPAAPSAPGAPGAPAPAVPGGAPAPKGAPMGAGDQGLQTLGWAVEDINLMDPEDKQKILQIQLAKPGTQAKPTTPGQQKTPAAPAAPPAAGTPAPASPAAPPASPAAPPASPAAPVAPPTAARMAKLVLRKINRRRMMQAQAAPAPQPAAPVQPSAPTPGAPTPGAPTPGAPAAPAKPTAPVQPPTPESGMESGLSNEERAFQILSEIQQMSVEASSPEQVTSMKASKLAERLLTELGMTMQEARDLFGLASNKSFSSLLQ